MSLARTQHSMRNCLLLLLEYIRIRRAAQSHLVLQAVIHKVVEACGLELAIVHAIHDVGDQPWREAVELVC